MINLDFLRSRRCYWLQSTSLFLSERLVSVYEASSPWGAIEARDHR